MKGRILDTREIKQKAVDEIRQSQQQQTNNTRDINPTSLGAAKIDFPKKKNRQKSNKRSIKSKTTLIKNSKKQIKLAQNANLSLHKVINTLHALYPDIRNKQILKSMFSKLLYHKPSPSTAIKNQKTSIEFIIAALNKIMYSHDNSPNDIRALKELIKLYPILNTCLPQLEEKLKKNKTSNNITLKSQEEASHGINSDYNTIQSHNMIKEQGEIIKLFAEKLENTFTTIINELIILDKAQQLELIQNHHRDLGISLEYHNPRIKSGIDNIIQNTFKNFERNSDHRSKIHNVALEISRNIITENKNLLQAQYDIIAQYTAIKLAEATLMHHSYSMERPHKISYVDKINQEKKAQNISDNKQIHCR